MQKKLSFHKTPTMKKILLLHLILLTFFQLQAQDRLLLPENVDAALDSILQEGYTLYLYEKIAWVSTDEFIQRVENKSGVRQVVFPSAENELSALFFRESDSTAVFSFKMDLVAQAATLETEPRPLTDTEKGVIPFGNDITVDFDEDFNLITWRKEHNTFIPARLDPDEEIGEFFHTYVPDKPFISPTDICTFLLYGHDLYGMNSFSVLSTAFNCVFTFDAEEFAISVKSMEE